MMLQRTPSSVLTDEQVREVRRLYAAGGISQGKLARLFGVAQSTINSIVLNKTYTEEKTDDIRAA